MARSRSHDDDDDGWRSLTALMYNNMLISMRQGRNFVTASEADAIRSLLKDPTAIAEWERRTGARFSRTDAERLLARATPAADPCFICKQPLPAGTLGITHPGACRETYKKRYA